jgi:pyruvate dehydrogenase E2 component (dihydrolipoamide acetyltransferase)
VAKDVIMPALGMAQETGTLIQWLKSAGDAVTKGEPLMEIETDKATVEIEAPATGTLSNITAQAGDVIPVGQRIGLILAPGESAPSIGSPISSSNTAPSQPTLASPQSTDTTLKPVSATPVAARLAAEHNVDISKAKPSGGGQQVRKEDVLAYLKMQDKAVGSTRVLASPKARRFAEESGLDIKSISGSGPDGAVLVNDVLTFQVAQPVSESLTVSRMWHVMADRLTQAWTTIPHFYLLREVNASRLMAWREKAQKSSTEKITFTDLLVKLTSAALRQHPRLNASWLDDTILLNSEINIGLAVAMDDGLLVPVIHNADGLNLSELASRRSEIVSRAKTGKLSLNDLSGGTFTISNLGMYGVDAFNAIVNPPQAAILAVSRITDRVVPVNGQPDVQPMMTLSLSCDHRVVDGARGAEFLQALADLIEEPMLILN